MNSKFLEGILADLMIADIPTLKVACGMSLPLFSLFKIPKEG